MARKGIVDSDGTIINVIEAPAEMTTDPDSGLPLTDLYAEKGDTLVDGAIVKQPEPPVPPPTRAMLEKGVNREMWRRVSVSLGFTNRRDARESIAFNGASRAVRDIYDREQQLRALTVIPSDYTDDRHWA